MSAALSANFSASAMASSSASLAPDPMEKCAVWAASPIRTMLSLTQVRFPTRTKVIHWEPRGWRALDISRWPWRCWAKTLSQKATLSSGPADSSPAFAQVSWCVSTMKVERRSSKR